MFRWRYERQRRHRTPPAGDRRHLRWNAGSASRAPTGIQPGAHGQGIEGWLALAVAAVIGVVGLVLGSILGFLPYINGISLGLGGFLGAWIAWTLSRRFG